jgi:hypothetical protein
MLRRLSFSLLSAALLAAAVVAPRIAVASSEPTVAADAIAVTQTPLFQKMARANVNLHSYQSHVHLAIAMHSFPYLAPTLEGTVYYKAPDKNAIVFDEVPALASLFKKVFPRLDPPAHWPAVYRITVLSDTSGQTIFRLDPKKYGTIDHLEVVVDNTSGIPVSYTYRYRNGGYIHFDQTVAHIQGVYVVTALKGHVELPSTTADANSTFSQYHINVPISDSVFADTSS